MIRLPLRSNERPLAASEKSRNENLLHDGVWKGIKMRPNNTAVVRPETSTFKIGKKLNLDHPDDGYFIKKPVHSIKQ